VHFIMMTHIDKMEKQNSSCCPICNSKNIITIYSTHDRHYGIQGTFDIVQCKDCAIRFLNPMPSEEELTSLYPEDIFYAYTDFTQTLEEKYDFKRIIKRILFLELRTHDPKFSRSGRILDIGCGSGEFLYKYKKRGWQTKGIEVNKTAASLGNKIANLDIYPGSLMQANFENSYFDYVRSNHSFEHITNPQEVLREVHRILKKDGKFFVGVPNANSFNAKVFREYWWYLGVPVHTFTYTEKTLSNLLEKNGFIIESLKYNSDYSGILGSIQIFLNRKNGKLSSEGFFIQNSLLRVLGNYISKILNALRLGDAIEIVCRKN
jgi:SAM-dependent methyltransferase